MNSWWASRIKVLGPRAGGSGNGPRAWGITRCLGLIGLPPFSPFFEPGVPERGLEACDTPPQDATGDEKGK